MHNQLQLLLHRHHISETACDGTLSIDGIRICDTAEHACHRAPAGSYRIAIRYSPTHVRKLPFLVGPQGVCLTIGNGIWGSTDGSILLGTYVSPGCVKKSRTPFMQLYNRIYTALRRSHEVVLCITEEK